jgi:hypothetical protein
MKKVINILSFAIALPVAGITYLLVDHCRNKKKEQESEYKPTFHTCFPEDYQNNLTAEDFAREFSNWSEHIYKLNNLKN